MLSHSHTLLLDGNPLDVMVDCSGSNLVVSLDYIHKPASTSQLRSHVDITVQPLQTYRMEDSKWVAGVLQFESGFYEGTLTKDFHAEALSGISNLLYTLKNLRKCGWEE